jgi:predicted Zn-dependent protease
MLFTEAAKTGIAFILAATLMGGGFANPARAQGLEGLLNGAFQYFALDNLSDTQEGAYGRRIHEQLVRQGKVRLSHDRRLVARVTNMGRRLARTSGRPQLPYRFFVVNDRSINAFTTMGGYVYVNAGLAKGVRSDAELAGVMAHEIGHLVARHAINQMRQAAVTQGIAGALGQNDNLLVGLGVSLYQRGYSRDDEYEADALGVRNLARAGYPANGLPDFLRRLQGGGGSAEFLSTHPASANRVQRLEEIIRTEGLPTRRR